ncbi:SAM-dependent methyltransferase [Campylobacter pinnipediorum subsp. pinnipediorum]|uniref:Methyltransferase domain-containing protein n=1 Tax=Campylobacter pinnipediorum subsp. pinnipediorum TaxID=1660067 RepID=A0AAX0LBF4_9BACT|nr:class I SAM-dependent methyltransferase [Campylobacter pinnipediorum]AQW80930.1 SAM-dependent methyltransferase [Campylobacter pinnipediorum subsp. pinnipediorum]AQW84233.1 SAM-dependent methyltransferase [Campylobacter pinnipediorum subsp. pinnipediorum]OPA77043.1 hypothetical protein BFG05_03740 [Campylobacter pinnipediorum subsp. pinnipediorum]OPA78835.1 hypothetical protein BFG04_02050 [Campylobacter pinnipediorum subsp. pinnipediorum]
MQQDNLEFWKNQALKYKNNIKAVNFDSNSEELEKLFLEKYIPDNKIVCDFGCGNGLNIINLAKQRPKSIFYGIDAVKEMIENANSQIQSLQNIKFLNLSATDNLSDKLQIKFDIIISKRLLINLKGDLKYKAINNIYKCLKQDGMYIMMEAFIEPLEKINKLRAALNLEPIQVHHFNEYLKNEFLDDIKDKFKIKEICDFNSIYYFISRVLNAANSSPNNPSYDSKLNQIALALSKTENLKIDGLSPEIMYIFKKL